MRIQQAVGSEKHILFGTGKGGGSHEFFGHAEEELPTFSDYVADAAGDALEVLLWGA